MAGASHVALGVGGFTGDGMALAIGKPFYPVLGEAQATCVVLV